VLRGYEASDDTWPTEWIPRKREAAQAKYAAFLEQEVGNL
jgi:acyl-CoA dehydrogenase